uniref:glycosyltransferase n=1 Tax=Algoriphagus sp. TaxID=1872435 RepID=UPI004047DA2F
MPKILLITAEPLTFRTILSGFPNYLKKEGWEVLLVSRDGREVYSMCRAEEVSHEAISFSKGDNFFDDVATYWHLFQLIKREKPDLIHSFGAKAGFLGTLAGKHAGFQNRIHSITEMPVTKSATLTRKEKWTISNATALWVNSSGMYSFFSGLSDLDFSKFRIIGNGSTLGVDFDKFNRESLKENHLVAATMRMLPSENDFIILAVGKLSTKKGMEELIHAFLNFKFLSTSKLVLIGEPDLEENRLAQETLTTIREHPRVVQIDWTDHVAHHLALADVVVQASHTEGFSNVLLEAAAMQVPIICSNCVGNSSFIQQQKTGLIFPVGEHAILREALEFSYVKRDVMASFADALYKEVKDNFDRKRLSQLYLRSYEEAITN